MTKHTMGQRIALGTFLNDYDANLLFQAILDDLCGEQAITSTVIQEYYEDWYGETLAESINDLAQSIDRENAAPDMLEALEVCLEAIQPYYDSDDDGSLEAKASNMALAAINKAKGL